MCGSSCPMWLPFTTWDRAAWWSLVSSSFNVVWSGSGGVRGFWAGRYSDDLLLTFMKTIVRRPGSEWNGDERATLAWLMAIEDIFCWSEFNSTQEAVCSDGGRIYLKEPWRNRGYFILFIWCGEERGKEGSYCFCCSTAEGNNKSRGGLYLWIVMRNAHSLLLRLKMRLAAPGNLLHPAGCTLFRSALLYRGWWWRWRRSWAEERGGIRIIQCNSFIPQSTIWCW